MKQLLFLPFLFFVPFISLAYDGYDIERAKYESIIEEQRKPLNDVLNFLYSIDGEYAFISQRNPWRTYMIRVSDNYIYELPYIFPQETHIVISDDKKYVYTHNGINRNKVITPLEVRLDPFAPENLTGKDRYAEAYTPLFYKFNLETEELETLNFLEKDIECDKHLHISAMNEYGKILLGCSHPYRDYTKHYLYDWNTEEVLEMEEMYLFNASYKESAVSKTGEIYYYDDYFYNVKTGEKISYIDPNYEGIDPKKKAVYFEDDRKYKVISLEDEDYGGIIEESALPEDITIYFDDILLIYPNYEITKNAYQDGWLEGTMVEEDKKPRVLFGSKVNRVEFAKMLMLAFKKGEGDGENLENFPDIEKEAWYIPYLSKAVEEKIMKGYKNGEMKPGNNISLVEGVKMTLEAMGEGIAPVGENQAWYENYMSAAQERFPELKFLEYSANHQLTRGECIELISAGLGLYE